MKPALRFLALLATVVLVGGCVVHTKDQLAAIRSAGLAKQTVRKLEHRGVLTPADLIELKKRRVEDETVIRHLDRVGVDYVVRKDDIRRLRSAGVGAEVITSLIRASDRFVADYYAQGPFLDYSYGYWNDPWCYPYYPRYFHDPWWPYGGAGFPVRRRIWHP